MDNQNVNQNMNMSPADYLASISPAVPEPVSNDATNKRNGLIWVILSLVLVVGLAITIVILSIVGFSDGRNAKGEVISGNDDMSMFEVVKGDESLPDLGVNYEAVGLYSEGLVAAIRKSDNKTVFLDSSNNVEFTLGDEYKLAAYEFHDGRIPVQCKREDGKNEFGYLSTNGELVIACQYSYATSFENGLAQVTVRADSQDGSFVDVLINKINTSGDILESEKKSIKKTEEVSL